MADTLAERVQLVRAEEQADASPGAPAEERTVDRSRPGGQRMGMIGVRLPANVIELLGQHGMPSVVARGILLRWAQRVTKVR
jgi:predicted methyltransferase